MGELNSFPGRQCCSQAHSLHRLLCLRGGVRPQVSGEAARPLHGARASWQPQRLGQGRKCQPDTAYSVNHSFGQLHSCISLQSQNVCFHPHCRVAAQPLQDLWSLYGLRCWQCFCSFFIVDTCYLTLLKKPFASGASIVKYRSVNVLLLASSCTIAT